MDKNLSDKLRNALLDASLIQLHKTIYKIHYINENSFYNKGETFMSLWDPQSRTKFHQYTGLELIDAYQNDSSFKILKLTEIKVTLNDNH